MTPEEILDSGEPLHGQSPFVYRSKAEEAIAEAKREAFEEAALVVDTHVQRRYGATGGSPALEPVCLRIAQEIREKARVLA